MIREAVCGSCQAPIFWGLTVNRKREPVDLEPVENGNIEIGGWEEGVPLLRHLKKGEAESPTLLDPPPRYMPHFATCPHAPQHRKRN